MKHFNLGAGWRFLIAGAAFLIGGEALGAPAPEPSPGPLQLRNISARARVLSGDRALIGGFIIGGSSAKQIMIRALGPSLQTGGAPIPGRLGDPTLSLFTSGGAAPIASNDNWKDSQQPEIANTGIPPSNDLESAIVRTLPPGAYTAIMRGRNDGVGIGLVEVYELGGATAPQIVNLSARAFAAAGDDVLIGGIIVGGNQNEDATIRVVLRAVGPSLTSRGISDAMGDPTLELIDRNGARLAFNDDAADEQLLELQETGLVPPHAAESAIVTVLRRGNYTAIVRGKNNTSGTALVEVFDAPPRMPGGG